MHHPTDRIAHTTAFVTPVVEHWLEREIAQWVHPMKDRSDDLSHHKRTLLPRSYISINRVGCWQTNRMTVKYMAINKITTTLFTPVMHNAGILKIDRKYRLKNVLFNRALRNLFTVIFIGHMVKYHSDSERRNPLLPLYGLHFPISIKQLFCMHHPKDRIVPTKTIVTPVVEH